MNDLRMGRMARSGKRFLAVAALALSLGTVERGDHVFTLSGVSFDDERVKATGTFTTDDTLSSLVNYDITTSGGTLTGFKYTHRSTTSFSSLPAILVLETASLDHLIQLTFTGLSATGAPITIGQFDSFRRRPTAPSSRSLRAQSSGTPSLNRPRTPWPGPPPWRGSACELTASPHRLPGRMNP